MVHNVTCSKEVLKKIILKNVNYSKINVTDKIKVLQEYATFDSLEEYIEFLNFMEE